MGKTTSKSEKDTEMTNLEAIEILKKNFPKCCRKIDGRLQGGFDDTECEYGRALLLAIKALESNAE